MKLRKFLCALLVALLAQPLVFDNRFVETRADFLLGGHQLRFGSTITTGGGGGGSTTTTGETVTGDSGGADEPPPSPDSASTARTTRISAASHPAGVHLRPAPPVGVRAR